MRRRATPSGADAVEDLVDGLVHPQLDRIRLRRWIGHVPVRTG
jgi:hypothetical protein